jgi:hypothetical protein
VGFAEDVISYEKILVKHILKNFKAVKIANYRGKFAFWDSPQTDDFFIPMDGGLIQ